MSFFKFRKRIKLLPGLWINLSKKGVSLSAGVKGFTVNSRGRSTVSLPGTGLSYVVTSKRRPLNIPDRAQKEAYVSALWDKYVGDIDKLDKWAPVSESTPEEIEEHLALLHSNKSMLQEDYDAWRIAKDAYLAEIKPLVTEESYQRVCGKPEDEAKTKLFSDLTSIENMLYQAKEQATPIDVRFSVRENAPGPPQFHFITPNGEGVMDMFGNVLSVVKSNSLFSAETKKVQNYAEKNKDGFVDKMYKLWAEAHANQPVSEVETRDGTALYVNGKTVGENEPPVVVDSVEQSLAKPSTESKAKPATAPPYGLRILLALLAIAIIASMVLPKDNAPLDQPNEVKINSRPVLLKESDEQIRAENDEVLKALRKPYSISSPVGPAATLRPKESDEQIRAQNNKVLDDLPKTKHHRAG